MRSVVLSIFKYAYIDKVLASLKNYATSTSESVSNVSPRHYSRKLGTASSLGTWTHEL